jgi:uncharacterized protein (DUF849 family)
MTQTPIAVTYTLEEILGQINQNLADINQKIAKLQEDVNELKIGQVRIENELKGEIKVLDTKIEGISKRLDTQEFINRSVIVGFVLAVGAAVTKILFPNWLA